MTLSLQNEAENICSEQMPSVYMFVSRVCKPQKAMYYRFISIKRLAVHTITTAVSCGRKYF